MASRISRQELYDLIWSEPMRTLAPRFDISDVALRKTCVRAFVPVPERGYWAKLNAGKPAIRIKLPPRPPGLSDVVEIGGRGSYYRAFSDEELLGPVPDAPSFPEPLSAMEAAVRKLLDKVKPIRALDSPHTEIRKILRKEEERRLKYLQSNWSWEAPLFDAPFEQRRLRLLNSLFMAVAKAGARPHISGATARDITVRIHDQNVGIRLDTPDNLKEAPYDRPRSTEAKAPLRLVISASVGSTIERHAWQDAKDRRLEDELTDIGVKLVMSAELQYREGRVRSHEWWLTRRVQRIEEIRIAKEKAEREERERQERLAQERIEQLISEADALTRAETIRTYVQRARELGAERGFAAHEIERWAGWALAAADGIDPIRSGRFLEALKDQDPPSSG